MRNIDEIRKLTDIIEKDYENGRKNAILQGFNDAIREIEIYAITMYCDDSDKEDLNKMKDLVKYMKERKEVIKNNLK